MAEPSITDLIKAIAEDQTRSLGRFRALHDLVAALLADRANQSANPMLFVRRFADDERDAVYRAVAKSDDADPIQRAIQHSMMETKESIFVLAEAMIANPDR